MRDQDKGSEFVVVWHFLSERFDHPSMLRLFNATEVGCTNGLNSKQLTPLASFTHRMSDLGLLATLA